MLLNHLSLSGYFQIYKKTLEFNATTDRSSYAFDKYFLFNSEFDLTCALS